MAKTYRQKIHELGAKALKSLEDGLNDENPSNRYTNSVLFLNFFPPAMLDQEIPVEPDVLDSDVVYTKDQNDPDRSQN